MPALIRKSPNARSESKSVQNDYIPNQMNDFAIKHKEKTLKNLAAETEFL